MFMRRHSFAFISWINTIIPGNNPQNTGERETASDMLNLGCLGDHVGA